MKKFSSQCFLLITTFILCSAHFECKKNICDYNPTEVTSFSPLSKSIINNYVFFTENLKSFKHISSRFICKLNDPFFLLFNLKKLDFVFNESYISKCSHAYQFRNILKSKAHPPTF